MSAEAFMVVDIVTVLDYGHFCGVWWSPDHEGDARLAGGAQPPGLSRGFCAESQGSPDKGMEMADGGKNPLGREGRSHSGAPKTFLATSL